MFSQCLTCPKSLAVLLKTRTTQDTHVTDPRKPHFCCGVLGILGGGDKVIGVASHSLGLRQTGAPWSWVLNDKNGEGSLSPGDI